MGVRPARSDAPARGVDQRRRNRREGSPLPLAGAGPAAGGCAGIGGESVLDPVRVLPSPLRGGGGGGVNDKDRSRGPPPWPPLRFGRPSPQGGGMAMCSWRDLRRRLVTRELGL